MKQDKLNEVRPRGTPKFPVELYTIDSGNSRYVMPYHRHPEFEIIRITEGQLEAVIGSKEITASRGDIIFVNCGTVHGALPVNCVYKCIVFETEILDEIDEFSLLAEGRHAVADIYCGAADENWEAIRLMVDRLISELEKKENGYKYCTVGLLYSLFGELYHEGRIARPPQNIDVTNPAATRLKKVLEWIDENYSEEITLDEMAAIAGMSRQYFCLFFKKHLEKTPIEYVNICRIDNACRMLRTGGCQVTDAAFSCGFNDLSYFVRTFRKYRGMTPKQYRQKFEIKKGK